MKKAYNAPKLTTHGNIESITQAFGTSGAEDTVQFNGVTLAGSLFGASGSQDGVVIPE
ncbi:MAG: lasso peptide [Richelia sp. RM2_1_2]|nr:lasso peptide [Richelia sp. RM2_1_2]